MTDTDRINELCAAAERYRDKGLKPLPLDGKNPGPLSMVGRWQLREFSPAKIRRSLDRILAAGGEPGIGVQMNATDGPIDFEVDTPEQVAKRLELFDGVEPICPAFDSSKGDHWLFAGDPRLESLKVANLYVPCAGHTKENQNQLIVRLGCTPAAYKGNKNRQRKGSQSAFPPSANKTWKAGRELGVDLELAPLPESVIQKLLAISRDKRAAKQNPATSQASNSPRSGNAKDALEAMLRHKPKAGETDASSRLILVARCAVQHNVPDRSALRLVRRYEQKYPFPKDWSDDEILERLRSAEERSERGSAKILRKADDIGNGQRFADQHNENARFSYKWNRWLIWRGGRWLVDEMGFADRMAKRTARSILGELERINDLKIRDAMYKWAKQSASRDKVSAMLKMAQSEPQIALDYKVLDSRPWLFNCKNGTVDLRTGELRQHRREDYLTARCNLNYPTDYSPPVRWLAFLNRIFAGNANLIAFIQRLMGYSLVGEVVEHVLPIFYGEGANGKTVLTGTWLGMLGDEYGFPTTKEFLIRSKSERHPTEMAAMYGKRLVVSSETDEGARLDEARVKHLTGGNQITARRMREDFWTFDPAHLLLLETNYRPVIVGTEHAIWRRVLLVPFNVKIPEPEQDKELASKLRAEWPMILRWAVDGCQTWQTAGGLCPPAEVQTASAEYRESSDLFAEFIADCCVVDPAKSVRASALYNRYSNWMKDRGQIPQSLHRIGPRLQAKFAKGRDGQGVVYKGIGLLWEDVDYQFENLEVSNVED